MKKIIEDRVYRVTFDDTEDGNPNPIDIIRRPGFRINAISKEDALNKLNKRYPNRKFTLNLWEDFKLMVYDD